MSALDERHCRAAMPGREDVLCGRHKGHCDEPGDTGHRQCGSDGGLRWPSASTYKKADRKRLEALMNRGAHLLDRTAGRPGFTFDAAELAALGWALREIIEARGPLPPELEQLRASIWDERT